MSDNTQLTITGEQVSQNNVVEIQTEGRVIRPFKQFISKLVREYEVVFDDDGVHVCMVEPANVACYDITLHSEAFEEYWIDGECVTGIGADSFGSALQHARYGKSSSDDIDIVVEEVGGEPRKMRTFVEREFGGNRVELRENVSLIDPDSIRNEPDIPNLNIDGEVDISVEAFCRTISALSDYTHVNFHTDGSGLYASAEGDTDDTDVFVDCDASGSGNSMYSMGYLEDIRFMLQNGLVDDITVRLGDEFPMKVEFEREDVYSGTIMLAPSIKDTQ